MRRGLPSAPRWAWVVMALGLIWLLVGGVIYVNRDAPSAAASTEASEPAADTPRVVIIGDSYTEGSGEGGNGPAGWPALLQGRLPEAQIGFTAAGGSGYVTVGVTGRTFADLAAAAPLDGADVVLVFGSRNDGRGEADAVAAAAADLYAQIRAAAPDAVLVVIGPPWVNADVPAFVEANRDAVQAAAAEAGATWVDPLAEGWFFDRPELIGSDGVHPTDEGHLYLADRLEPVVRQALGI